MPDHRWIKSDSVADRFQHTYDRDGNRLSKGNLLNTTFGENGMVVDDLGVSAYAAAVALQSDGKILVACNYNSDMAVVRYDSSGSRDYTFGGGDGIALTSFPAASYANAVTVQPDGKILLAGGSNGNFALARFTPDGILDGSFDGDGMQSTSFGYSAYATAVAMQGPERIVLAGNSNGDFAVACYQAIQRVYVQQDGNWNVTSLTDGSGQVTRRIVYDTYGQPTVLNADWSISTDPTMFAFGFQGGRYDSISGSYSFRYREFSCALGRWLQQDPAMYVDGVNLYQFVRSSPVSHVDPSGMWGSDVHSEMTARWAEDSGYNAKIAKLIGSADAATDDVFGGFGPLPWMGDQSFHFDRNRGNGRDTRLEYYEAHLARAIKESEDPCPRIWSAVAFLGMGLHALQDWVAHGDFGYHDTGSITTVHNEHGPKLNGYSGTNPKGYPDDPNLDAVGGDDGRPAGKALHYGPVVIGHWTGYGGGGSLPLYEDAEWAVFEKGTKRITKTEKLTKEALNRFKATLQASSSYTWARSYFFGERFLNAAP